MEGAGRVGRVKTAEDVCTVGNASDWKKEIGHADGAPQEQAPPQTIHPFIQKLLM